MFNYCTTYAGDGQVVFVLLLAWVWFEGAWWAAGNLAGPEERHHEGLLGARAPAPDQTDPARGQGPVCGGQDTA